MVYITYMYVNKRVELAQRGIALQKMYVLLLFIISPTKVSTLRFTRSTELYIQNIKNKYKHNIVFLAHHTRTHTPLAVILFVEVSF